MEKAFIITVDTEGDNLWNYKQGDIINVRNAEYIPRFQSMCEEYGFKPVYLTNYEMAHCDRFVNDALKWLEKETCEIGVHLHAWNNPPLSILNGPYQGNPYLVEYSDSVMKEKFEVIYNLIAEKFGVRPVSHRAGRWAMDHRYFKLLEDFDIKVDCSVTPGVNWAKSLGITRGGSNYRNYKNKIYKFDSVMEVPATVIKMRKLSKGSLPHRLKSLLIGEELWLRPAICTLDDMKKVVDYCDNINTGYLEFMIHSSELMPNGSIYFKTEEDIEKEYRTMRALFEYVKDKGYVGYTLREFFLTREIEKK